MPLRDFIASLALLSGEGGGVRPAPGMKTNSALLFIFQDSEFDGAGWQVDVWAGWVPGEENWSPEPDFLHRPHSSPGPSAFENQSFAT